MTAAANPIPIGKERGFTYVSVVILAAIVGLVAAATLRLGATLQRSAAEQELLHIGMEYSNALASYAAATPAGQPNYPPSFKELLRDPRFPQVRRHLRRVYVDPMTGKAEWGLVTAGDKGGILAIYSLSKAKPVKVGNFPARFVAFEGKASIGDWKFSGEGVIAPGTKPGAQQPAPGNTKPGEQPAMPPAQPVEPPPEAPADSGPQAPPEEKPEAKPEAQTEATAEAPPEAQPAPQAPPDPEPEQEGGRRR